MYTLIVLGMLCAGAGIAVQMPIAALAARRVGLLESVLAVNLVGLISLAIVLVCRGAPLLNAWRQLPWYAFLVGPLGIGIMAAIAFAIPRIGISSALVLSIAAQLTVGALLDHIGFLGLEVRTVDVPRAMGVVLVALGAWLVAR